jgi:hypothetical protein
MFSGFTWGNSVSPAPFVIVGEAYQAHVVGLRWFGTVSPRSNVGEPQMTRGYTVLYFEVFGYNGLSDYRFSYPYISPLVEGRA